jgi:hypothetical protein
MDPFTLIFVVSLLIAAATLLSQKKPGSPDLTDKLQSTATRGSYIPLVIGRARVSPIFAWVDDVTSGAFYAEDSLHVLCIGPGSSLRTIFQDGKTLWEGPINPKSHPSGTQITLPDSEGTFEVHWGFPDDPVLSVLAASTRHGLSVRYAFCLKILWIAKKLGGSRVWPRLEYEVECPCYSHITSTSSELPLEADDDHPTWEESHTYTPPYATPDDKVGLDVWQCITLSGTGEIAVRVLERSLTGLTTTPITKGSLNAFGASGGICKIYGWADTSPTPLYPFNPSIGTPITTSQANIPLGSWKFFWIKRAYIHTEVLYNAPGGGGGIAYLDELIIVLGPEVTGNVINNKNLGIPTNIGGFFSSAIEPLDCLGTDGVNPIHVIDQLLFAKKPFGAGKDRSKFDPRSIEQASVVLEGERIRGGCVVQDGEGLESVLAALLQDISVYISWDPSVGLHVFVPVRYDDPGNVTDLPPEMILSSPEMIAVLGARPVDTLAFTFKDRRRNYREEPLVLMDDGQVSFNDAQRAKRIPIEITTDAGSAARLIPRRQQEALANLAALTFETNHATQLAVAGKRFSATATEGVGLVFRITAVTRSLDSSKVILDVLLDNFDAVPSSGEEDSVYYEPPSSSPLPPP